MTAPQNTHARITEILTRAFAPDHLELIDESSLHRGHASAPPGGESHFRLTIIAAAFDSHPPIRRHRMINDALQTLMNNPIHALSITALTPAEAASRAET